MPRITFIDTEVQAHTGIILDIGATNDADGVFHSNALDEFKSFIASSPFICGHNIIDHDKIYLEKWMGPEKPHVPGTGADGRKKFACTHGEHIPASVADEGPVRKQ
ncbi:MAG: hypothetical protein P1P82_16440 [Bacteroidales bacterium]|nr:hypothetical protein [Bacteroidales bacterium]MDT8432957.1 hypothetical protein [Bacteroidales bacterium]